MDPFHAKLVAATTGSTLTALTMTPFDVVKTRLQTQMPEAKKLSLGASYRAPSLAANARHMSTLSGSIPQHLVNAYVLDHSVIKAERGSGFVDAINHVVRAEGVRGLWKGVGTAMLIGIPSSTAYMLAYDHLVQKTLPPILPASIVPLLSGMIARCSVSAIISPLELVRTNLQATPASLNEPQTLRSVLTSIQGLVRSQGVLSLWRGLGPTLWRDAPFSGVYWTSYEYIKQTLAERHIQGPWVAFTGGAASGVIAVFFTSPFDVMKTRRQALLLSGRVSNVSAIPFLLNIARTEGWRALFAGLQPRVAKIIPFCGVMVGCFEGLGTMLSR